MSPAELPACFSAGLQFLLPTAAGVKVVPHVLFQRGEASHAAKKMKCFGSQGVDASPRASGLCPALSTQLPSCQAPAGSGSGLLPSTCAQKLSEESTKGSKAEESFPFPGARRWRCQDPLAKYIPVTLLCSCQALHSPQRDTESVAKPRLSR